MHLVNDLTKDEAELRKSIVSHASGEFRANSKVLISRKVTSDGSRVSRLQPYVSKDNNACIYIVCINQLE